jgi:hypothetical protein
MKIYALSIVVNIFIMANSFGEIKNGYGIIIADARRELENINQLLAGGSLSPHQKQELKTKTRMLENIIEYHEVTKKLLLLFSMISPDLYNPIDTIKDCKGRPVDVYVKFLPVEEMDNHVGGTTNILQSDHDEDAYCSKYGPNTVAVKIVTVKHSLIIMAHEFGHISYQVPNLRIYQKFYSKQYKVPQLDSKEIGHHPDDRSGHMAYRYERRFRQEYYVFLKKRNGRSEVQLAQN